MMEHNYPECIEDDFDRQDEPEQPDDRERPEPVDERIPAWTAIASHPFFHDCYLTDGTLLNAMLAKLARTQGEAEWGVRIWGTTTLARSEETARAEVEFWAEWDANQNPDPHATKFPRELVSRAAAGVWEVTE